MSPETACDRDTCWLTEKCQGFCILPEATQRQVAFLEAVRRFIEAEYVHARAHSAWRDRGEGRGEPTRDKVDLAHADLMNWPAITCDLIISKLGNAEPAQVPRSSLG